MSTIDKAKIEAIFPLSYMQQGLLFHHLSNSWDQGVLLVQCVLKGTLDFALFEQSWNRAIQRHSILRTTIHWKNLENPVQIIHQEKSVDFTVLDWTTATSEVQATQWEQLCKEIQVSGVPIEKGGLLKVNVIVIAPNTYRLLWPSHHILVDGWSSHLILKDVFEFYEALSNYQEPVLKTLPAYKSYLSWIHKKDRDQANAFWSCYFKGFQHPSLFKIVLLSETAIRPITQQLRLSKEETVALQTFARSIRVTVNTVVQMVWGFVLSRYFGTHDVVYGTTVSGRSGDFPNITLLTGMFMNVQPVRIEIKEDLPFEAWFRSIQKQQQDARQYEHVDLDQIMSCIDWPAARQLFDSLLIFENYPGVDTRHGGIEILEMQSGLTSTYPVTMAVVPGEALTFTISVLPIVADTTVGSWILESIHTTVKQMSTALSFASIATTIPIRIQKSQKHTTITTPTATPYVAPKNEIELQLVSLWETLFGIHPIGVQDDFFEIGGKSLLVVKMFSLINTQHQTKLPPTVILEHPTIEKIARLIQGKETTTGTPWKNVVPLRAKGTKAPVFCVHAGGGHVFFYTPFTRYLDSDRPVYAIQPSGIYGGAMHENIEVMAQDYVKEVRSVQPQGPYYIMVYCFSTAVGLEMVKQLQNIGEEGRLIVIDTMAEQEHLYTKTRVLMRVSGFVKRFIRNPFNVIKIMLTDRCNRHITPLWIQYTGTTEAKNLSKLGNHLVTVYKAYQWQPYELEVTLVLTEKPNKKFNEEYQDSWEKIAKKGVEIIHTLGNHRTLFEEPDVQSVAKVITTYIKSREGNHK